MDKDDVIKKEILDLLLHYFGEKVSSSYYHGYAEETLPIYIHNAFSLLISQIGQEKSKLEIDKILVKYSLGSIKYE